METTKSNELLDMLYGDSDITMQQVYKILGTEDIDVESLKTILNIEIKKKRLSSIINYICHTLESPQKASIIFNQFPLEHRAGSLSRNIVDDFGIEDVEKTIVDAIDSGIDFSINIKLLSRLSDDTLEIIYKNKIKTNSKNGLNLDSVINNPEKYSKLIDLQSNFIMPCYFQQSRKIVCKRKVKYAPPTNNKFILNFKDYFEFLTYDRDLEYKKEVYSYCEKRIQNFDKFLTYINYEDINYLGD